MTPGAMHYHIYSWGLVLRKGGSAMRDKIFVALSVLKAAAAIILIAVPAVEKAVSVLDTCKAEIGPGGDDED